MRRTTALLLVSFAGIALLAATTPGAADAGPPAEATLDAPADADAQWCYDLPCPCIVCIESADARADRLDAMAGLGTDCIDPDCCPDGMPCEGVGTREIA